MEHINQFVTQYESNPIYQLCLAIQNQKTFNHDLVSRAIDEIFKAETIDCKLGLMIDWQNHFDKSHFPSIQYYQHQLLALDNKKIMKQLFHDYEKKNPFNIYQSLGFDLPSHLFYDKMKSNDATFSFHYGKFIYKVKTALFDVYSYPPLYQQKQNQHLSHQIAKVMNLNLAQKILPILKYPNMKTNGVKLLNCFKSDIEHVFLQSSKNINDDYCNVMKQVALFKVHPSYYHESNLHLNMPRQFSLEYLMFNARNTEPEKFQHFISSFKSTFIDADKLFDSVFMISNKIENNKFLNENLLLMKEAPIPENEIKQNVLKGLK